MIDYILCDVEGTTTDIHFVRKVLLPFAYAHIERFYQRNDRELLRSASQLATTPDQVASLLKTYIDQGVQNLERDRIQGLIWQQGFASGVLQGHVYPDIQPAFARWKKEGIRMGLYSSLSVWIQKLLFGHSVSGDLCVYVADHFDLAAGYKEKRRSYEMISKRLFRRPSEILFLSSREIELDCAKEAGMQTIRIFRSTQAPTAHSYERSFAHIGVPSM